MYLKPHKLAEVIRKRCVVIDFVGGLEESDGDIPHGEFPSFLKKGRCAFSIRNPWIRNLGRRTFVIILRRRSIAIGFQDRWREIKIALEKEKGQDGKAKAK